MDNPEIPLDLWFGSFMMVVNLQQINCKKKDNIKLWKILDILMVTMTFY